MVPTRKTSDSCQARGGSRCGTVEWFRQNASRREKQRRIAVEVDAELENGSDNLRTSVDVRH